MRYMLLIYGDDSAYAEMTPEQMADEMPAWQAFDEKWASIIRGGDALQPGGTATTLRVRGGERLVSDGPFAEGREQLGGYYVFECDLDTALTAAAECPGAHDGAVELRPIMEFPG